MDVPHIQKPSAAKTDDLRKPERVQQKQAESKKAGSGIAAGAATDTVSLSPKAKANAKLLQRLREKYDELPDVREGKVEEARQKIEQSALKLSSEEIVRNILDGGLFSEI